MQYALTITAPNQSGFFSKIMMAVRRRGCQLSSQRRAVQGDAQIITLVIAGTEALAKALAEDIEALGDAVKAGVQAFGQQSPETAPVAATKRAFLIRLLKDHPNLADMVKQVEAESTEEGFGRALAALGERVGRREYAKNYALGSPLKLQAALPRMVVPAMKPYVNAVAEEDGIAIPACSFCNRDPAQGKMCGFLRGYIAGLLQSAPTTANITVEQTGCVMKGQGACRFTARP